MIFCAWKIVIRILQISMNPLCYISCSLAVKWQTSHLDVYCPVMLVTQMLAIINNFSIMEDNWRLKNELLNY